VNTDQKIQVITHDSPLRRLPPGLNRQQTLYLDGIRHAAEIADFAHLRLRETLTHLALTHDQPDLKRAPLFTAAFLDAWAIVDAIDRLRSLLQQMPGVIERSQGRGFGEVIQGIRDLRNVADHLATRVDYVIAKKSTALGVLSWFTLVDAEQGRGLSCMIVPGTLSTSDQVVVNPAGKKFQLPTGLIHLAAGEYRVDLSETMAKVGQVVSTLEQSLEQALQDAGVAGEHAGADLMVTVGIVFLAGSTNSPTEANA
jgi:hypothetical protein